MDCWVPELIEYDSTSEWKEYEAALYEIFKRDFLESKPVFNGLPVSVRTDPRFDGKEEGFWHVTCRDYSHKDGTPESRDPDMERCRRIKWPRAFIENYGLCERDTDPEFVCDGTITWWANHTVRRGSPAKRFKILLPEERYIVVLEPRRKYCLLITAFYIEGKNELGRILREAKKNSV